MQIKPVRLDLRLQVRDIFTLFASVHKKLTSFVHEIVMAFS